MKGLKCYSLEWYINARTVLCQKTFAFTFEQVVWEARQAIGDADANDWIKSIEDIVNDPFFENMLFPYQWVMTKIMGKRNPEFLKHTWVMAHPEAYRRLGYFWIWRSDGSCEETNDANKVRVALLENKMDGTNLCESTTMRNSNM